CARVVVVSAIKVAGPDLEFW
nr:immunoglobulin heavy chain junction region [Macaca mulatta]